MPRYSRDSATKIGTSTARVQNNARSTRESVSVQTMMAMLAYSTSAAAVCPDGKDEVGGATSNWGTDGRGLLIATVAARKEPTSINRPAARNAIASQRRPVPQPRR